MKTQSASPIIKRGQHGFTLVELMVAITLGFIIIGAVGYLFLGSRQTYRSTDAMSRIQENARYALQTMARNVRMAGYVGCGNLQAMTVKTIASSTPVLSPAIAITGLDSGSGAATFGGISRPAGDAISVMGAFGGGVSLSGNLTPVNANAQVQGNPFGFQQNDVLVVTNCTTADIFKVTNVPGSSGLVTVTYGLGSNTSNRVSGTYGPDAFVLKMEQYTYFIGTNPSGGRSLYRNSLTEGTVELADNVWDMRIQYLVNGGTGYIPASSVANWAQVVSARISLLLVSQDNVLSSPQTYNFNGASVLATDRRMYQVFTTTVGVRNRLS